MSSTTEGRIAENNVAAQLMRDGHSILEQNWRTRRAEIDIVSKRGQTVYFSEVKYRSSDSWGDGFDYITSTKLKQMHFAAEQWIAQNNWTGEVQLLAASVNADQKITFAEL